MSKQLKGLALFFLVAWATLYYSQKAKYEGVVYTAHAPARGVEIRRDADGVAYVRGERLADALYGLGFAHAQDRLFQLNMNRLVPQGRLAEIFGEKLVDTDIALRHYGLHRAALKMNETLSAKSRALLQAYADGVNDAVAQLKVLPVEFLVLGAKFDPWSVYDSLCFLKLLNFMLSLDHVYEFSRAALAEKYGREAAERLYANHQDALFDDTTIMNDEELKQMGLFKQFLGREKYDLDTKYLGNLLGDSVTIQGTDYSLSQYLHDLYLSQRGASNAWVISGKYTTTGKPLLANDPHLATRIPSVWYLCHLTFRDERDWQQVTLTGASMAGAGTILSGRGEYAAFGVTTLYADVSDFFIEKIDYEREEYLYDGKYRKLGTVEEVVRVKGVKDPIVLKIRTTHHGPVFAYNLTDPNSFRVPFQNQAASWAWPGAIANDKVFDGLFQVLTARSVAELEEGMYLCPGPPQAVVWGTVDGHIGFFGNGLIPVRKNLAHYGFPLDGTTSDSEWAGFVSREHQPRLVDPEKGFIIVANNKFATDNIVNHISVNVQTTARARRLTRLIEEQIARGEKFSPEDMQRLQSDVHDSFLEVAVPSFLRVFRAHYAQYVPDGAERAKLLEMVDAIEKWDFEFSTDSAPAAIMLAWEYNLHLNVLQRDFPDEQLRRKLVLKSKCVMSDHFFLRSVQDWALGEGLDSAWCVSEDSIAAGTAQPCAYQLVKALRSARALLVDRLGTEVVSQWRYGDLHAHDLPHTPFSKVSKLKYMFHRSFPGRGNQRTVHVSTPEEFDDSLISVNGANLKIIHDLSEDGNGYWVTDSGASESVFSKHYDDQLQLYVRGEYLPIKRTGEQNAYKRLLIQRERGAENGNRYEL